jgi:hypothetical protein
MSISTCGKRNGVERDLREEVKGRRLGEERSKKEKRNGCSRRLKPIQTKLRRVKRIDE